jgi:YgiT-type zinc finger domain-containing protein
MWKIPRFALGMTGRGAHCPRCNSSKIHRSRRKGLVDRSLLRVLGVHAYRCKECDERYYSLGHRREPLHQPQTSPSETRHALKG